MPFVDTRDSVRLHYELHDNTDPWKKAQVLILQHGFGRSSGYWFRIAPYLSRHIKVVCPDLRGLGHSSRPSDLDAGITMENYMADFLAVADSLQADTFHVAGESSGGMLGLTLAARHPERVRSLTLFNSSLTIRQESQKKYSHGYGSWEEALRTLGPKAFAAAQNADPARFPEGTDPGLIDWATALRGQSDIDVMIAFSRLARTIDLQPYLRDLSVPVLGIYPTNGAVGKSGQERVLAETVPDIRIVHLPSEHAMRWLLMPATCARYVLDFVGGRDGRVYQED